VRPAKTEGKEKPKELEASKPEASREEADLGQAFHPAAAEKSEDAAPKNGKKTKTKTAEPEDSL
jgi:hypothetical protein